MERTSANYATTGPKTDSSHPYAGTFDGNGHKLTLSADLSSMSTWAGCGVALFHTIDTNGIVRNLNLDVQFQGYSCIGGVAVKNYGTIERVTVDGNIKAGRLNSNFTGGIAAWSGNKTIDGEVVPGKILYCVNKADIDTTVNASSATYNTEKGGGAQMGGICGAFLGEMRYCVNLGAIWANSQAGALFCLPATIPASRELLVVSDCYNAGEIKLTNTVTLTGSSGLGGLFGGRHDSIISWAEYEGVYEITNVFNFGDISRAYELNNYNPNNTGPGAVGYISSTGSTNYLDYHAAAIFSNIYYRNDVPTILFSQGDLNGDADDNGKKFGTFRVKSVIHGKTPDDFKTAQMAVLLNNGRRGADAPWEYVEGNDYPTLKFENTSGTPGIDYIPVALDIIVDFGYGGVIATAEGDIEQCTVAAT
ncbi:MAG: hypothetical protein LBL36_07685, partial [Clostridiales Family XIII bacterium]|nr:hypothetical protein [Clostridiales Family XIII bacterium]